MNELSERIRRNVADGNLLGWVNRLLLEAANEIEKQAAIISALTKNKDEPPMSGRQKSNCP